MVSNLNLKKMFYFFVSMIIVMCMCIMPTYAWGRKLITKSISGSLNVDGNIMYYSFNSTAGITYNDSNNITQISDLSFSNKSITMSNHRYNGDIIPRQISKNFSGNAATYTVKVTRTFQGYYSDNVNYTLTYRSTDAGTPYSIDNDQVYFLVDIVEGEPYDVTHLE